MISNSDSPIIFIAALEGVLFEFTGIKKAYSYTLEMTSNLLTGETAVGGLVDLKNQMEEVRISDELDESASLVFHLFYEAGLALESKVDLCLDQDTPMGFFFEFSEKRPILLSRLAPLLRIETKGPSEQEYGEAFKKGLRHLRRGDCYQYNLTFPFFIKFAPTSAENFLAHCWKDRESIGRYASFTSIKGLKVALLSNSPECLFQIKKEGNGFHVETFPIKGTQSMERDDEQSAWSKLSSSLKDESELFMITDLMRSDLSRLTGQWADVLAKKEKMIVPGLLHSYSHLRSALAPETTLLKVAECLFPGGSITGAPKIRVMEIIHELEGEPRGFYCGSTVIKTANTLQGSINIRSGELDCDRGVLKYHSGGGITFESSLESEYQEMWDKVQSFSRLLL